MARTIYREYAAAEEYARSLGLKNQGEWRAHSKAKLLPSDIPGDPQKVYKGQFRGWGKWLGTETVANKQKRDGFVPYAEAKLYAKGLVAASQTEWWRYWETHERPSNIPYDPPAVYGSEWESWGAFLGTDYVAHRYRKFRPFSEARDFARSLGLCGPEEWWAYWEGHERPEDIPSDPPKVYGKEWCGWRDFLGASRRLTRTAVAAILGDLLPNLTNLKESELYTILQRSGLLSELGFMEGASPMAMLRAILNGELPRIRERVQNQCGKCPELSTGGYEASGGYESNWEGQRSPQQDVADLATEKGLKAVDALADSGLALHADVIEDLVNNRVAALWDVYGHDPDEVQVLLGREGGHWYKEITRRFREQLEDVNNLPIPPRWSFSIDGTVIMPNAMQRRTAILVRDHRRVMNLSTAGAGKMLAAILASRVVNAPLTVVITNLSTVDGWTREISRAFPNAPVFTNTGECAETTDAAGRYLVLNYDKFQGVSRAVVTKVAALKPELLVLDEMHFVKQRSRTPSQRRVAVGEMMELITANNADLRVLGMSATASINNLRESKKLLELITGQSFPHLRTKATVDNAMAMHHAVTTHGFRFRYRPPQELREQTVRTVRNDLLARLLNIGGSVLDVERLLLRARLDAARPHLKRGTIIYTHYIAGMVETIKEYVAGLGMTTGVYTGTEKTGIDAFVAQEVDVLIGSAPVAVGLNGLQYVSNRLVVVSLPWTYAQYEQLVGRIHRQGSAFAFAEVVVPLVSLEVSGHEWSWDQERMRLLLAKRTLTECVLDGVVPEMAQISHEDLLRQSRETLHRWVKEATEANETETDGTAMQEALSHEMAE